MLEMNCGKRLGRAFFARDGITVAKELLGKVLVHETEAGTVRGIITEVESYMGEEDKGSHTYGGKRTERTEPMYHAGGTSYVYLIYGMYSCMNIAAMREGTPQAVLLRSVIPADGESERRMLALRLADTERRRNLREKRKAMGGSPADNAAEAAGAGDLHAAENGAEIAGDLRAAENGTEAAGAGDLHAMSVETGSGRPEAAASRKVPSSLRKHLADGPGKLCIAMGISREDNDIDMTESGVFYVTEPDEAALAVLAERGIPVEGGSEPGTFRIDPSGIQAGKRIGIDYAEEAADYLWRFYL